MENVAQVELDQIGQSCDWDREAGPGASMSALDMLEIVLARYAMACDSFGQVSDAKQHAQALLDETFMRRVWNLSRAHYEPGGGADQRDSFELKNAIQVADDRGAQVSMLRAKVTEMEGYLRTAKAESVAQSNALTTALDDTRKRIQDLEGQVRDSATALVQRTEDVAKLKRRLGEYSAGHILD